jgi:hypothetical protein
MAKSGFGAGKIVLIVVGVAVVAVVAATVLGVVPGLSAYLGFAKQKNLGIVADKAAFDSAMKKAGVKATYPTTPIAVDQVGFHGTKPLDAVFTDDEISALINAYTEPFAYKVKTVQVVFHDGGKAEASAMVTYQGKDYPGYIAGDVAFHDGIISGTASKATGAGIPAGKYLGQAQDKALEFLNLQLGFPGLVVKTAQMSEGKVRVTGTVPATIFLP